MCLVVQFFQCKICFLVQKNTSVNTFFFFNFLFDFYKIRPEKCNLYTEFSYKIYVLQYQFQHVLIMCYSNCVGGEKQHKV